MDFVYVGDVARANVLACTSAAAKVCLNIGSGIETTVNNLVGVMAHACGATLAPIFVSSDGRPAQRRWCSIEKPNRLIGFEPTESLETGLERFIEWRHSYKPNA
jgi:UDP-glucose 4-epimerase